MGGFQREGRLLTAWLGIALIGIGVVWQCVLTPGIWGLGLIAGGFAVGLVTRQMKLSRTPLDWPIGLIVVMSGLSLWITAFPEITSVQVFRLWSGIAGLYGVAYWAWDRPRFDWLAVGAVSAGVVFALAAFFVVRWPQTKFFLIPSALYARFPLLVADAVHPNIMASLMVLCLPIPLAFLLVPVPKIARWTGWHLVRTLILAGGCGLMAVVLLLTKSRGGYIAGVVGGIAALWFAGRRRLAGGLLVGGLVAGLGLLIALGSSNALPDFVGKTTDPSTLAFRFSVWRVALWMVADFPFTGVGMGAFNAVAPLLYPFNETKNPGTHNVYLQTGVDLGIPGMIAYFSVQGLSMWMALRTLRLFTQVEVSTLRALTIGTGAGLFALMVHGLVDNTVWNTRAAFFPWLIIGIIVALHRFVQSEMFATTE